MPCCDPLDRVTYLAQTTEQKHLAVVAADGSAARYFAEVAPFTFVWLQIGIGASPSGAFGTLSVPWP